MPSVHRDEASALRILTGSLAAAIALLLLLTLGVQHRALWVLVELAELCILGAFAALVATAATTSGWDGPSRRMLLISVTFGVCTAIAEALADLLAISRSGNAGLAFAELVATRQEVSLILSALGVIGLGLGAVALSRQLGRTRHLVFASATALLVVATIVSERFAFDLVLVHEAPLWSRIALLALALMTSASRYSMLEISTAPDLGDHRGTGDDKPEAWRRAALGLRVIRVAELARVLLVALVILLGLMVSRAGPGPASFQLYALDLALLLIAAAELIGLSYLASIPVRSGARGATLAALAVGLIGLAIIACSFGADLLRGSEVRLELFGFTLGLGPRLTMLVTLTAVFLALRAIFSGVGATAAARSSGLGALFYVLAMLSLTGAELMELSGLFGTPSLLAKLAAFGFFVAAIFRLLVNLRSAVEHLETQRRNALGSEFS